MIRRTEEEYTNCDDCAGRCHEPYTADGRYKVIYFGKKFQYEGLTLSHLERYFEKLVQSDSTFPAITREECLDDFSECLSKAGKEFGEDELWRSKQSHPQVRNWVMGDRELIVVPSNGGIHEGMYIATDCAIRAYFRLQEEKWPLLNLIREKESLNKR